MKFVMDMMGGDYGTKTSIPAVLDFLNKHDDVEFYCVGAKEELTSLENTKRVHLIYTTKVLKMDTESMEAARDNDSSMAVAFKTYIDENCDALIGAGSSAAMLTKSVFKIKRIEGISRPGFCSVFPTMIKGKNFVGCDLGANTMNTVDELHQFALMGSIYYRILKGVAKPKVYLLNIGTEEEKGNDLSKETYKALKADERLNFMGNMEGREPLRGECDVLITDGYTGNIFLKTLEGTAKVMNDLIKQSFKKNLRTKIGYLFAKNGFNDFRETMDYKNVGGAIILGVNGIIMKAHGSTDAKGYNGCFNNCYKLVKGDVLNKLKEGIKEGL